MQGPSFLDLVGFGPEGWGAALLMATGMTLAVATGGFAAGSVIGAGVAGAKLSRNRVLRTFGDGYTTVLRGIPDLLVIYLFYFGGSAALGVVGQLFGADGFIGMPAFLTGVLAIGVVSGAYQAEVFRGAFNTISRGELEAARSVGMRTGLRLRRIIVPQVLRYAMPGLGYTWQLVLKESALRKRRSTAVAADWRAAIRSAHQVPSSPCDCGTKCRERRRERWGWPRLPRLVDSEARYW